MESIFLIHPRESVSLGQGTRVSQNCFPLNASECCLIKQPPTVMHKAALYILLPIFHFSPVDILWQALWTYSGSKSEEARWWLSTHIIELYLHPFHSASTQGSSLDTDEAWPRLWTKCVGLAGHSSIGCCVSLRAPILGCVVLHFSASKEKKQFL